jgi:hypothetical protein
MSHRDLALAAALVLAVLTGLTGLYGALCWQREQSPRSFWLAVRAGQILAVAYAILAGVLYLAGDPPSSNLYYLYAVLPVAIGFVAEQLRLISADLVLSANDLEDAADLGRLDLPAQQRVVIAIMRRETGVMAAAAFAVCFLALRAWGTY